MYNVTNNETSHGSGTNAFTLFYIKDAHSSEDKKSTNTASSKHLTE